MTAVGLAEACQAGAPPSGGISCNPPMQEMPETSKATTGGDRESGSSRWRAYGTRYWQFVQARFPHFQSFREYTRARYTYNVLCKFGIFESWPQRARERSVVGSLHPARASSAGRGRVRSSRRDKLHWPWAALSTALQGSGSMARQGGPRDGAGRVRSRRRPGNPQTRLGTTASSARVRRTCWTTRSPTPRRFPGPTSAHGSSATTSTRWTRTWPRNGGSAAPSGPRRLCSRSSWPASRWLGLGSSAGCRLLLVFAARMCKWSADSWRCAGGSLGVAALLSPERAPQPLDLPACCSGSGEAGGLGRHTRSLVRFLRRHAREREPAKARYQVQKKDWGKVSRFLIAMAGTTSYAKTQSKTANRHRGQTGAGKKSTGKGAGKSAGRSKAGSLAACTASSGCSRHTGTRSTGWFFVRGAE